MSMTAHLLIALMFVALLLSACQPIQAPIVPTATPTLAPLTPAPTPTTAAVRARPLYAVLGQFHVGQQSSTLQVAGDKIDVAFFYPMLGSAPDTTHGPYPLVIFSVGLASSRYDPFGLLSDIASHGFVSITWTPRGETDSEFWAGAATRPIDLQRMIDYAGELNAPGGLLAGMIDTDKIAVGGGSSGGWTALEGGGAQMDLGWCANPDLVAQLPESNCPQFVPHQQEIAAMLGLPSVPTGLWPASNDPRVDAVVALAPDGDIWGADYQGVAAVMLPTLIMAGSKDTTNLPELCAYPIYEHLGSADKSLAVLDGADHDLAWYKYGDPIEHLLIAFLLAKLEGDLEATNALLPANVNFTGVTYETSNTKRPTRGKCRARTGRKAGR